MLSQPLSSVARLWRRRFLIAAAAFPFAFPYALPSMASSSPVNPLTGEWRKLTASSCGELYPDQLIFQENGIYFGHRDPAGTFTTWDAGKYELVGPEQVRLSTANDAIVAYRYSLAGDVLTFEDGEKCVFRYRRTSL